MKIEVRLEVDDKPVLARLPYQGAAHVVLPGGSECPSCGSLDVNSDEQIEGYDTVTGRALCARCRKVRGRITVHLSTLFGMEEDRRVLAGRWRVY